MIFESDGYDYKTISHTVRRRDDDSAYIDIRAKHLLTGVVVNALIIINHNRKSSLELSTIDSSNEVTKLFCDDLISKLESGVEFNLTELKKQYTTEIEKDFNLRRYIREGIGITIAMYGSKAVKEAMDKINNGGRLI